MNSRKRGLIGLGVVPLLLLAGCGGGDAATPKGDARGGGRVPEVGYVVIQRSDVPVVAELSGRTAAFEMSEVRPQVSGIVRRRLFTEGATVRAGQTLYEIDPSLYRATANEANANLASAAATQEAARIRADRLRPLAEIEAVSRQELTDATAQARQAAAAVAQSQARLETARINLRFTNVPAPISGRIGRSLFTVGALVTANQGEPLAVIQRLDPMFVDIQQSSAELLSLRRALAGGGVAPTRAEVRLKLEDGSDYPAAGTVEFAEAMVDPATGTVTLRARFPNPGGLLLPGMFVRTRFSQAIERGALLVPQQAVSRDPRGNATVFLVGPGNRALLRTVQAARAVGQNWVVTSGLAAGDRVIVQGLGSVKADQPVRPVPASAAQRVAAPPKDQRQGKDSQAKGG